MRSTTWTEATTQRSPGRRRENLRPRSSSTSATSNVDDTDSAHIHLHHPPKPRPRSTSIMRQAVMILLAMYLSLGVIIYTLGRRYFDAQDTHPVVDAIYFCVVTMCTIGYGNITPRTPSAKLFKVAFVLLLSTVKGGGPSEHLGILPPHGGRPHPLG
ncbi:hypothetical protein Taro_032102 [Colocasia esculenta]|uniref:Potassium channel domain-containing protein n=1 Tax=Colocasia esculenta TaxID=4460 RepID=A0A843VRS8_COLES|nr:hypothetical protein [Colocasia esculenta]